MTSDIVDLHKKRAHSIKDSHGVKEAFRWIRRNKWLDIGRPLSESMFYSIIREVNKNIALGLVSFKKISLPERMGELELRKSFPGAFIKDGKVLNTYPVDWKETIQLWKKDEECRKKKTLVKREAKEIYRVKYNKRNANYDNKTFYKFSTTRQLKRMIKEKAINGELDAFIL